MNRPPIRSRALVVLGALAALGAAASGCSSHRDGAEAGPAAAAVRLAESDVARVTRADLVEGIPVSGTLEPAVDVKITAPLSDVIVDVLVREGAAVAKGQVLARFRTLALEPEAASAEAELKMRAADHERMRNLLAEGAVSERDVESAEAAWRAAQAARAQAQRRLADATVRAPVSGVIAERSVHSGDRVGDGDPMFRLVNTRELEFEATVPAEHAAAITRGAPVSLTVSGRPVAIQGRVARVNAAADPATRQIQVYVVVANPAGALVGGLFASGTIVTRAAPSALAAPIAAVRSAGDTTYVLVVEEGALARRPVTAGLRDEARDRVELVTGVSEGDVVIVGPIEGLEAGRPVIVGADAPAAARAAPKPAAGGGH